ncbi:MAG TPA: protein phosphatase 2C domain-containing protein, partial [Clostridia bacterium]
MLNYLHNSIVFLIVISLIIIFLILIRYYIKKARLRPDIMIGNAQTVGRRKEQEDHYSTLYTQNGLMAVLADGMGGYTNGKVASNTAVSAFIREFSKAGDLHSMEDFFKKASRAGNREILERCKGSKSGTTVVAVVISDGNLYWTSVGDSAIVLFRKGEFINLNKKHTFENVLEEKYLSGGITEEEIKNNAKKKMLTNYLGHTGFSEIETGRDAIKMRPGDKVILCSDGVYNSISELELERILSRKLPPSKA